MKTLFCVIAIFLFWALIGYGMMSFELWELDPSAWTKNDRNAVVQIWFLGSSFSAWIPFITNEKKK